MKQTKTILFAALAILGLGAMTFTSCKKEPPPTTYLTYTNDTYTPVVITAGGSTSTIDVGSSATYAGQAGSTINVTATTSGSTSSGTLVGDQITWNNLSAQFPGSGTATIGIDVSSDYFYLYIQNLSAYGAQGLYVNYGSSAQSSDNIGVPNDGQTYGIGYYPAYNNTELYINATSGGGYWTKFPVFAFIDNQQYTWTLH